MKKIFSLATLALAIAANVTAANSKYITKVYDFLPAPGQFINMLPLFSEGDTKEQILAKVAEQICGNDEDGATPGLITLGAYGGYVVFGFDHPVVNVEGEYDFQVYGNAFSDAAYGSKYGSTEPGIVMVSVDANENGIPDDEWFELAGCEYYDEATFKNYQITYYKPDPNRPAKADPDPIDKNIFDRTYVRYTTNDPDKPEGYVMRNKFHLQSYWPEWVTDETITFTGTRLASKMENMGTTESPYYTYEERGWGYVDDMPNKDYPGFKIDWAVDAEGNPVNLKAIDFIKVYTAVNDYAGWLGEASTEVTGGEDLHPEATAVEAITAFAKEAKATKVIENGVLYILKDGIRYTLLGHRLK